MTITEIATSLRLVLKNCVNANKDVSIVERRYFASLQNDSSDEEIVSFWLSVSCLEDHQVPMFVVERWAERASTINEWMALLERNTTRPETFPIGDAKHSSSERAFVEHLMLNCE